MHAAKVPSRSTLSPLTAASRACVSSHDTPIPNIAVSNLSGHIVCYTPEKIPVQLHASKRHCYILPPTTHLHLYITQIYVTSHYTSVKHTVYMLPPIHHTCACSSLDIPVRQTGIFFHPCILGTVVESSVTLPPSTTPNIFFFFHLLINE